MIAVCPTGKRVFTAKADARRALKRAQTSGARVRQVYRCPHCTAFHMTSQTKDESRSHRQRLGGWSA